MTEDPVAVGSGERVVEPVAEHSAQKPPTARACRGRAAALELGDERETRAREALLTLGSEESSRFSEVATARSLLDTLVKRHISTPTATEAQPARAQEAWRERP